MEGSLEPISCLQDNPNQCARSLDCPVLPFWKNFGKVINDYVDSVTLADLRDQTQAMMAYDYSI